jgi:hypothetical protein
MEDGLLSMDTQVDAGNGSYTIHGRTVYDPHGFDKGGYGRITLRECLMYP